MDTELNEDNFVLFAMHHYDNPQCRSTEEFEDDLKRFMYLNKLFSRHIEGDTQIRLMLNHIIVLANVFGVKNIVSMLYFKTPKRYHNVLRTLLVYLRYEYDTEYSVPYDDKIMEALEIYD